MSTLVAVGWLALMTLPVLAVVALLGRVDGWLDRRQIVRGAERLCRDHAARRDAEPPSGGLFAIPRPEDDPS